jgi:hypothetical protein
MLVENKFSDLGGHGWREQKAVAVEAVERDHRSLMACTWKIVRKGWANSDTRFDYGCIGKGRK